MLSHSVARRTHEFGVRIALGATSQDLFRQVLGEALTLAGIGLALGLPLAYGLNLVAASQLLGYYILDTREHLAYSLFV
jgi:ABC-type antimicrobial peptide transport system permease subunit